MPKLVETLLSAADACAVRGSVSLLEMMNSPPEDALKVLIGMTRVTGDTEMSFTAFMRSFLLMTKGKSTFTGSCGQTSDWLADITTKLGKAPPMVSNPTATALQELKEATASRWYCRMTSGNHSFLIEHAEDAYCVYQSFHGCDSVQLSIDNIAKGECVFRDKTEFFRWLDLALLDGREFNDVRTAEEQEKAYQAARKQSKQLTERRLLELSEAVTNLSTFPKHTAANLIKSKAEEWEWDIAIKYDEALGDIVDMMMDSGKAQQKIFHGKIWTTATPVQMSLNVDPATAGETTEYIGLKIAPYLKKWAECFDDDKSSMEERLKLLNIKI